jgi:hypothetical protein
MVCEVDINGLWSWHEWLVGLTLADEWFVRLPWTRWMVCVVDMNQMNGLCGWHEPDEWFVLLIWTRWMVRVFILLNSLKWRRWMIFVVCFIMFLTNGISIIFLSRIILMGSYSQNQHIKQISSLLRMKFILQSYY